MEARYSNPNLEQHVHSILDKCKEWLHLGGSVKILPSSLVDTDTIEVWLPK